MEEPGFYCEKYSSDSHFLPCYECCTKGAEASQLGPLVTAPQEVRGVASGVEVLGVVLDVVADEGADEEVAVVVALQGTDPQVVINTNNDNKQAPSSGWQTPL